MSVPRQPLLDAAVIALDAPTQAWSDLAGDMGASPVHGVFHGDLRHIARLTLAVSGSDIETISHAAHAAGRVTFAGLARGLDSAQADPFVRVDRERRVVAGSLTETISVTSHRDEPIRTTVTLTVAPDFSPMQAVKAGMTDSAAWRWDGEYVSSERARFRVTTDGAVATTDALTVTWTLDVLPGARTTVSARFDLHDTSLVVTAPTRADPLIDEVTVHDPRARRWLDRALDDLTALRLALPHEPDDAFYAAGAPWFFTLFGRDSIWAARLALPVDREIAESTLRVLARLQGTRFDAATAEAPGKIVHELRSAPLSIPGEDVHLPPLYYGTVDATPLWVCLLADAHDAGMADASVRELLPHLRRALEWLTEHGASSGGGFIDYVDENGHGLANQGWKDSGDSIQWRDGTLAEGPIALCEVQAYAYEAAMRGAALLDRFGEPGGDESRAWAGRLRARFRERYWVTTPEGRYPAIALDHAGRAVDSLTSNIGHLIGTGLLDADEEAACAALLRGRSLSSGYGIRTLSTGAAGYWPLSYHGGSVWIHDTAIAVHGMMRSGLWDEARHISRELLDAAEGFDYRVPELHSGDGRDITPRPIPYPAACRPQAWSAAAAVVAARALAD